MAAADDVKGVDHRRERPSGVLAVGGGGPGGELLNPRHERTSRVDDLSGLLLELTLDLRGDAVSADDSRFVAAYLNGLADGGDALASEALHLLFVVDQRAEGADL